MWVTGGQWARRVRSHVRKLVFQPCTFNFVDEGLTIVPPKGLPYCVTQQVNCTNIGKDFLKPGTWNLCAQGNSGVIRNQFQFHRTTQQTAYAVPCTFCVFAGYSWYLKASSPDIDQRKLRPCGRAYRGLHQFTSPNKYRLSYFEIGRGLKPTGLLIIFTYIISCLMFLLSYLISYHALSWSLVIHIWIWLVPPG